MTPKQKLQAIVSLFGSASGLASEMKIHTSSITRRVNGEIGISQRDWLNIEAAVTRRMEELWKAVKQEVTSEGGE